MKNDPKNLQLTEQEARKLFNNPSVSTEFKTVLISTFGEKVLKQDILEILKTCTLDDCYEATGRPKVTKVSDIPEDFHPLLLREYDEFVMTEFANEGKKLSFFNKNEKKCYPYYDLSSGSVVFISSYCCYSFAIAGDASRRNFISEERAKAMGDNPSFKEVVKDILDL